MFGHLMQTTTIAMPTLLMASTTPLWDASWIGDVLVILAAGVAWLIYKRQRRDTATDRHAADLAHVREQRAATLAHLQGVKAGLVAWTNEYFTTSYEGQAAADRSEVDFNAIMQGYYFQNFRVSTEPVASLIRPLGDAWPLEHETLVAASVALQRMGVFNQLVQQQTDFNLRHAAELQGDVDEERKKAIGLAGRRISEHIHGAAIGDASWYEEFIAAIDKNIDALEPPKVSRTEAEAETSPGRLSAARHRFAQWLKPSKHDAPDRTSQANPAR